MLKEGKTDNYLKYAIGEIILIIIQKYYLNLKTITYCSPPKRGTQIAHPRRGKDFDL
ncbi:hypothetical protein [Marixanthomonas spongiae]|nr:hypothetical protein [Marixanthomonas spongiae]